MKIQIEITIVDAEHLSHTSCVSFLGDDNPASLFEKVQGKFRGKTGMLYWCNSYLEAKFLSAFFQKRGSKTAIYFDGSVDEYVVLKGRK